MTYKKEMATALNAYFWLAAFLMLFVSSCYEPRKGCLDPLAANYDVSADEACIDLKTSKCQCEYPSLRLNLRAVWQKDSIRVTEGFFKNIPFIIGQTNFFLTDFELVNTNGVSFFTRDSVNVLVKKSSLDTMTKKIRNDIVLFNLRDTLYKVGEISTTGQFSKIRFRLGLATNAARADLKKVLPTPHVLRDSTMYQYGSLNRYLGRIFVSKTKTSSQITTYNLQSPQTIEVTFAKPILVEQGRDALIKLKCDYSVLFKNINFNQSETEVLNQLSINLKDAFR